MAFEDLAILTVCVALVPVTLYYALDYLLSKSSIIGATTCVLGSIALAVLGTGTYREIVGSKVTFALLAALMWAVSLALAAVAFVLVPRLRQRLETVLLKPTQAVLIHLPAIANDDGYDMGDLEAPIQQVLARTGLGEYDGDEIGPDGAIVFLYCPDAEALFEALEPVLLTHPMTGDATVELFRDSREPPSRTVQLRGAV